MLAVALVRCVGGVLFVVDGDAGDQGALEDAAIGWFALVLEVVGVVHVWIPSSRMSGGMYRRKK